MLNLMNTNSRGFNYFFFLTVIFFVLILPAISLAQWKLALPKFVLDGTNQDSEGLGDKARKILKDEIRSTGIFAIIEGTTNKDLGQKNLAIKSPEIETFVISVIPPSEPGAAKTINLSSSFIKPSSKGYTSL